ncbi:unnamed protein product [marine sediment metagenome]|uniref:Uncharacterized protein n=1 Tax=marine sediment metagenome TaxID=412755 RepID=X0XYS2_9ZZZZ
MTEYSLARYTIEMLFIKKLNECAWWKFRERKGIYNWRREKLNKLK